MTKLLSILLLAAASVSCTGDERPPPSSPHDPANPRAAETPFDAGADPFAAAPSTASSAPAPTSNPHAGHSHGGAQ